jgi:NADH-quinone oxidoreductase subunit L
MDQETLSNVLPTLLGLAWLLPLVSFALIVFWGRRMGHGGHCAGYVATAAIMGGFVLSLAALVCWLMVHPLLDGSHHEGAPSAAAHSAASGSGGGHQASHHKGADSAATHGVEGAAGGGHDASHHEGAHAAARAVSGDWYVLGQFGSLRLTIGYYIDALTLAMFCMVTLVASCIHVYSFGYMHEELEEVTDHLAVLSDGKPLRRRGRFYRFYQFLSLFCFSMLGLVIAGNLAQVFAFWELVGICSYLLIGFYIERKSASTAANKAFIVNRVGDFGMIIGLMAVWTGMGTFSFANYEVEGKTRPGIFEQVRPEKSDHVPRVPDGMVRLSAPREEVEKVIEASRAEIDKLAKPSEDLRLALLPEWIARHRRTDGDGATLAPDAALEKLRDRHDELRRERAEWAIQRHIEQWRQQGYGYWLLVVAGLGIFCGCVGKSAQFPLHVWLPDAMEGPTPVSALIHAATMVAAGVYLVGRFYPVFAPEVLLVIAYVGCATLFIAATIAITATDIKRVLAYSTVSQLGYMMLALGLGGWLAGIFHLFTHAFFKALLFLGSGSVIHATGTNEMPRMGGLIKKMPWTAGTMLVGCLAIAGAGVPTLVGLSGYYSKDFIIAQALAFRVQNAAHGGFFWVAVAGAGITAFYMFRLWYMTFLGEPRDEHVYHHAHESPRTMVIPLVVLAVFATCAGWNFLGTPYGLVPLIEQARPEGTSGGAAAGWMQTPVAYPAEHESHEEKFEEPASFWAFGAAFGGFLLATVFYGVRALDSEEVRRQFAPVHQFLIKKWYFDELYAFLFVRPVLRISQWMADLDKKGIDWLADGAARLVALVARIDDWIDRIFVDGLVNLLARGTYAAGIRLRAIQTGNLRQYVLVVAAGTVALFVLASVYWNSVLIAVGP